MEITKNPHAAHIKTIREREIPSWLGYIGNNKMCVCVGFNPYIETYTKDLYF